MHAGRAIAVSTLRIAVAGGGSAGAKSRRLQTTRFDIYTSLRRLDRLHRRNATSNPYDEKKRQPTDTSNLGEFTAADDAHRKPPSPHQR